MKEDEAKAWLTERFGDKPLAKLEVFVDLLLAAAAGQNLIAPSTIPTIWSRHIVDSAQLLNHAPSGWRRWIDIGSGAGLPGIVVAILCETSVTLIEPRRLRVAFLEKCAAALGLEKVTVLQGKAAAIETEAAGDVVSARAVAALDALLSASRGFADRATTYLLPKGESAQSEVAVARRSWHGTFHVEQSIVDPKSGIVVATGVAPR